jgi:YggT family protein
MATLIGFFFFVLSSLLSFFVFVMFASMIASWLVFFNVINPGNPKIRQVLEILDRMTAPILEPFRRMIPSMGGLDLSFLVAYFVIIGIQRYILPGAENAMLQLLG